MTCVPISHISHADLTDVHARATRVGTVSARRMFIVSDVEFDEDTQMRRTRLALLCSAALCLGAAAPGFAQTSWVAPDQPVYVAPAYAAPAYAAPA